MMKELYEAVKVEVIPFQAEDIITTSSGDPNEGELD